MTNSHGFLGRWRSRPHPQEPRSREAGRPFTAAAFLLALVGLAMFPIGGLVGVVCAELGRARGDRPLALYAMAASLASFVLSFVVASWVLG